MSEEVDSAEETLRKRKLEEEDESAEGSDANNGNASFESPNGTNNSQRFLQGRWIFRHENGGFSSYDEAKGWVPVNEDEAEFILQLWMEQEVNEAKKPDAANEIDDEFLAQYRASYGVEYDYSSMPAPSSASEKEKEEQEKKPKGPRPPGWVDMDDRVHAVYISNLPTDMTDEEFRETVSKCGVVQQDARSSKPKLKLYKDDEGNNKGDGRCCYVKKESVDLALSILDGMNIRGKEIKVEKAHFELKGEYDPKKKRKKLTAAQRKRFAETQSKHFDWRPDKPRSYRPLSDCTVIIKNLFTLQELNEDASRLFDLKEELRVSGEKYGIVKKVVVYDNNEEGVASIAFETTTASDEAVKMLNGRIVRGRFVVAHHWDGKAKYKKEETEEERQARIDQWNKFVEGDSEKKEETAAEGK